VRLREQRPEVETRVEGFEETIREWRFVEEEGGEEKFDAEGWDLRFWRGRGREGSSGEEGEHGAYSSGYP
jgi:hypothetical protein